MTDLSESGVVKQLLAEMSALRRSIERLSAELAGKASWPPAELPFTRACQAVVDRYQATESAAVALEAWPHGRAHFYDYMRRCPELKTKWQATKQMLLTKRALQRQTPEREPTAKEEA